MLPRISRWLSLKWEIWGIPQNGHKNLWKLLSPMGCNGVPDSETAPLWCSVPLLPFWTYSSKLTLKYTWCLCLQIFLECGFQPPKQKWTVRGKSRKDPSLRDPKDCRIAWSCSFETASFKSGDVLVTAELQGGVGSSNNGPFQTPKRIYKII